MSETIDLLRSIDSTLKALLVLSQKRTAKVAAPSNTYPSAPTVASDRDLDDPKYGNGPVKFDPRDWSGPPCKGLPYSECPVEFLDLLAETNDYFAQKAEENGEKTSTGKPVAPYKRKEAARCRGWAERIRSGKHVQAPTNDGTDSDGWA